MNNKMLNLATLREETNSDNEDDSITDKTPSILINKRNTVKEPVKSKIINFDLSKSPSKKQEYKSPKKQRNSVILISQRTIEKRNSLSKADLCLNALKYSQNQRTPDMINHIKTYLKSMPSFMNIISKEKNMGLSENLIEQIALHLRLEYFKKNNLVCRFGEKGEKFYIILKGKVTFMVPKAMKCFLNFEEYVIYLMQLRKNNEFELLNNLIAENRIFYPFDDDDFDEFLKKEYQEYQRNIHKTGRKKTKAITGKGIQNLNLNIKNNLETQNELSQNADNDLNSKLKLNDVEQRSNSRHTTLNTSKNFESDVNIKKNNFSTQTYKKMGAVLEKINESALNSNHDINLLLGENSPGSYLRATNVQNRDLDSKGRKLVNIYHYEEMSSFETGQTFGFIALVSKTCKRASTAIVVEDSHLGVLTKEEYLKFFEMLSSIEKKNLYELLKFYSLIIAVSEHKFVKRFYHMFEYKKYFKNNNIFHPNKPFKELLVFSSGLFNINISVNMPELNDLITKIKTIKGRLLGFPKAKIERTLDEKRENDDLVIRRNYMSERENKILLKKYNFTISIISDHLILGYPDTVDPQTHMPLFNCVCTSAECDGYSISNKSIKLINEESVVIHRLTDFCLMKIQYNLTRLNQFKKEILAKIKESEMSSLIEISQNKDLDINSTMENKKENYMDANSPNNAIDDGKIEYLNRNELARKKNLSSNAKSFVINKLNLDKINNAIKLIHSINEETKNNSGKDKKKLIFNSSSSINKMNNIITFNAKTDVNSSRNNINAIIKLKEDFLFNPKTKDKPTEIQTRNEDNNSFKKENNTVDNNNFKHSLSQKVYEKQKNNNITKHNTNSLNNINFSLKKKKINNFNLFKNYKKELEKINDMNNKLLSPLITKNRIRILPSIKIKNKIKNFFKENIIKTEINTNKIKLSKMTKDKATNLNNYITDDINNIDQLSFVKDKFIVFRSTKEQKKEKFNTVNYELLPKIRDQKPLKIKKEFFKDFENKILDVNNINNSKNNEDTTDIKEEKNNNKNNKLSKVILKIVNKQSQTEKNINNKYTEINGLLENMQKITNEILTKK